MTNHDMVSFMTEAQFAVEKLKMLEIESLKDIKKKLDKYYMVMTGPSCWT